MLFRSLTKALEGTENQEVTGSGELVGNIFYMAPERTKKSDDVDGRADFFGLGVTLYLLLTGQMPFAGTSIVEVLTKIRQAAPPWPRELNPSIPTAFEAIVLKLLAKKPGDRHPSARDLLADLAAVAPGP